MKNRSLIIIPARSGSKRVKGKNTKLLGGKELLLHSIEQCKKIKNVKVIVSTDSKEISNLSEANGIEAPFLRPKVLSTDIASSRSIIIHAISWFLDKNLAIPDMVALKPPTNPFIKEKSMNMMIKVLLNKKQNVNSCVSICQARAHPFRLVGIDKNGKLENGIIRLNNQNINDFERSQDWPEVWEGSPAFRITKTQYFKREAINKNYFSDGKTYDHLNCIGYKISNVEATDIDDEDDFKIAESMLGL